MALTEIAADYHLHVLGQTLGLPELYCRLLGGFIQVIWTEDTDHIYFSAQTRNLCLWQLS